MSFSALRRALPTKAVIAASSVLALGGTLAIASSASAIQLPTGTSTDAGYSGTGTPASLWAISNGITNNLVTAAEIDQGATSGADDTFNTLPASPAISAASGLNATNVAQIKADWANTDNEDYYIGVIQQSQQISNNAATAEYEQLADAMPTLATEYTDDYSTIQQLIGVASYDTTDYPNGLFTVDGDLAVSSAATVTAAGSPAAYTSTISTTDAATGGFVLPSSFSLTYPSDYGINTALIGKEIDPSAEANPTESDAIGTVKLYSPVAVEYGLNVTGTTDEVEGKVFIVALNNNPTTPALEIWLTDGIYDVGAFNQLSFPVTVSFGEFNVGNQTDPLPMSSLQMSFPASTSPLKADSCSNLGTTTAGAVDGVANLAAEFGDTTDGYTGPSTASTSVSATATATTVTDKCVALTLSKTGISGLKSGKPSVKFTLADTQPFSSFTVSVPKGFSYSKLSASDLKLSGGSVKSIKVSGGKVTVDLKSSTKSVSVTVSKGIVASSAGKKAKTVTITVGASGKTVSAKIKA